MIEELKAARDAAWHQRPTLDQWLAFCEANSRWYRAYVELHGEPPPEDQIARESTQWHFHLRKEDPPKKKKKGAA